MKLTTTADYNRRNTIKNKKIRRLNNNLFKPNFYYDLIKVFKNPHKYNFKNKKKYINYNYNFIRNKYNNNSYYLINKNQSFRNFLIKNDYNPNRPRRYKYHYKLTENNYYNKNSNCINKTTNNEKFNYKIYHKFFSNYER